MEITSIQPNESDAPQVLPAADEPVRPRADEQVRISVRSFLARLYPNRLPVERRSVGRYPYPFLLRLTPVATTAAVDASPVVVVGKDLSERGFGFFHQNPLPFRRVIATLRDQGGKPISILVDVSWCRFTSHGWYESGGRFLRIVETPPDDVKRTA